MQQKVYTLKNQETEWKEATRKYKKFACPEKYQQRFKDDRIGTQKKKKS